MKAKRILLVGGGHTHALVLAAFRRDPPEGAEVVLVNPGPTAPYSGMLPGFVAGHYTQAQLEIDLVALCASAGARQIDDFAVGLDPAARVLRLASGELVSYDVVSFDVGITTQMPALSGFSTHAVPAKPLGTFAERWAAYRDKPAGDGPRCIAVIGGGVAGAELAMAMSFALRARGQTPKVHILDRSDILSEVSTAMRLRLMTALGRNGIETHPHVDVTQVNAGGVVLKSGETVQADFIVGAAGAAPHDWLSDTGLRLRDGFITVTADLRASDPAVFAVGDCADMAFDPRPKAGVYAVRQAPVLTANLRAAVSGQPMQSYAPQKDYLKLISLGRKSALGSYWQIPFSGWLVWRLKDWIDRRFMAQF